MKPKATDNFQSYKIEPYPLYLSDQLSTLDTTRKEY